MDATPCCLLLGTGEHCNLTGFYKLSIVCFIGFALFSKIQMVELLVAHGANLDSRSVLEETPLGET